MREGRAKNGVRVGNCDEVLRQLRGAAGEPAPHTQPHDTDSSKVLPSRRCRDAGWFRDSARAGGGADHATYSIRCDSGALRTSISVFMSRVARLHRSRAEASSRCASTIERATSERTPSDSTTPSNASNWAGPVSTLRPDRSSYANLAHKFRPVLVQQRLSVPERAHRGSSHPQHLLIPECAAAAPFWPFPAALDEPEERKGGD